MSLRSNLTSVMQQLPERLLGSGWSSDHGDPAEIASHDLYLPEKMLEIAPLSVLSIPNSLLRTRARLRSLLV